MRKVLGSTFVKGYRLGSRAYAKAFSLAASGGFASFGTGSVIQPPVRLEGERRIAIGNRVVVGRDSWLNVHEPDGEGVAIEIGDGTSIVGHCVLSAALSVRLGRSVLFARNVYVSDHMHAFDDPELPVLDQGVTRIGAVLIDDGAWLGENVVVGPGVTIGRGSVIGANSVVLSDVPAFSVAVGAPARTVKSFAAAA